MAATARRLSAAATDPGVDGGAVVWQEPGAGGRLLRGEAVEALPGTDPAAGGGLIAWRADGAIQVARTETLETAATIPASLAEELAVSGRWVAWRETEAGRQRIVVADTGGQAAPRAVFHAPTGDSQLGRPALSGGLLVFHLVTPRSSRVVELHLPSGRRRELVAPPGTQYLQPSVRGGVIALVRATYRSQDLLLVSRKTAKEQILWSTEPTARRDAGHEPGKHHHRAGYRRGRRPPMWKRPKPGVTRTLWTTALAADAVYVTRLRHLRGRPTTAEILVVARRAGGRRRRGPQRWVRR